MRPTTRQTWTAQATVTTLTYLLSMVHAPASDSEKIRAINTAITQILESVGAHAGETDAHQRPDPADINPTINTQQKGG
ncbi:MAG: hypothetical protein M0Z84_09175 [Gammaproteobacteria bacterium]|nr:hypothetical protein [Gammaproteobacteria bacterium]